MVLSTIIIGCKPKLSDDIAFVISEQLVSEYDGMKEAQQHYRLQEQQWMANLDTLRGDLQQAINQDRPAPVIQQLQSNIDRYSQQVQQQSLEEDQKMTQAVLEQINTFIEIYGEREGYGIILGTTTSGNVLYGDKSLDITEQLLDALNQYYHTGSYE